MKFILSVISALALLVVRSESEGIKSCRMNAKNCQISTGATDEDVKEMCFSLVPTTQIGKCLHDCVMRQKNLITDEGFQVKEYIETIRSNFYNENELKGVEETLMQCKIKMDPENKCETTFLVVQCISEAADDWEKQLNVVYVDSIV